MSKLPKTRPAKAASDDPPASDARVKTKAKKKAEKGATSGAVIGFEEKLWLAADKLRGSMDPGEYKHVVLGLVFLKYISDAFIERHDAVAEDPDADPEDRDHYAAENVFWVPKGARWSEIQKAAKLPTIGVLIDRAMEVIEKENPTLKNTLPKEYARPTLDKERLGGLIDLLSGVDLVEGGHRTKDVLGRVYEYFLAKFASAEGRLGGDFYTPSSVVRVLVEMIEPTRGRVYDPCCGSGGMFVQSEKFLEAHGGKAGDISVFGQESNATTWRLAKLNLAIRHIEAQLAWGDSFRKDEHKSLKADFILANPPFNISDWGGEHLKDDVRWKDYGVPPAGNANFAWLQHIAHHLAPAGVAGVVLANGSMSSQQSGEGQIRKAMVEADLVDCMVALPGQLFYATQIPVCLWFLAKNKAAKPFRDRRKHVLFIDARKLGTLVDRVHRELTEEDVAKIAGAYHAWRGEKGAGKYEDVAGFCKSATLEEITAHDFVLTPGRYVGAEDVEDDGEPFDAKMKRLVAELEGQLVEGARLDAEIKKNLRSLGYGR
jgi:type I restriction enzyme M protein